MVSIKFLVRTNLRHAGVSPFSMLPMSLYFLIVYTTTVILITLMATEDFMIS